MTKKQRKRLLLAQLAAAIRAMVASPSRATMAAAESILHKLEAGA